MGRGALGMSSWLLSLGATVVISGVPATAAAQPPSGARGGVQGPLAVHRDPAAEAIYLGRTRMAKGDCPGALEAFDAAMRTSIDSTVRRDRGLCHEQLGHPFPAIDDFRAYLAAFPDASDSEDIRARLNQLEVANGLGGTGTGGSSAPGATVANGTSRRTADHEDPFAVDVRDPNATSASAEQVAGSGDRRRSGNYDQEQALNERWDEAEGSPLRRGTGLTFGVFGRGFVGLTNGVSGYGVGATLRGSLGQASTVFGEVGYVAYRSGSDAASGERAGGLSLGLGYEARIRLDQFASNAIVLAGSVSYERITDTNTNVVGDLVDPRVKLGYRHVFGPGFGLELAAEVAQPLDVDTGSSSVTFIGGTLALLVGF